MPDPDITRWRKLWPKTDWLSYRHVKEIIRSYTGLPMQGTYWEPAQVQWAEQLGDCMGCDKHMKAPSDPKCDLDDLMIGFPKGDEGWLIIACRACVEKGIRG